MFRIVAYCENRRLGDVMESLAGKVIGQPEQQVVIGARSAKGGVEPTNGTLPGLLLDWAKEQKKSELLAHDVREFLTSIGRAPTSYTYVIKQATIAGVLRKVGTGSGMRYLLPPVAKTKSKKGKSK